MLPFCMKIKRQMHSSNQNIMNKLYKTPKRANRLVLETEEESCNIALQNSNTGFQTAFVSANILL